MAGIIAIGDNPDERREILGLDIGTSECPTNLNGHHALADAGRPAGREAFHQRLSRRHWAAALKVLSASWQRCRVRVQRNVLNYLGKSRRRVVSAFIAITLAQDTAEAASTTGRAVADQIWPEGAEADQPHG
ncbi:transposase [Paracoccus tibetensis]|uniref:transposase n=1 Tax=Paracoccus tibetensis TaxID=336292 RepID=UPI001587AB90|nr:transposase [Paracoccus tibetensis]